MANGRRNRSSSSTPSLVESFSPEKRAKAERRRKRDKLAKHHCFLGSCIPMDLVIDHSGSIFTTYIYAQGRSRYVASQTNEWSICPIVQQTPPQTLYHTRHAPTTVARSQPTSPVSSIMISHYLSDDGSRPGRDPNQSAYTKGKKTHRLGTSESTTFNIPPPKPERDWRQSDMIRRVMFIRTCMARSTNSRPLSMANT
ncbi:hypothetical protein M405DRAFT_867039 [Rhizopogon salebrosus TDB-379]|nr:hypothetical protein M405DRAFT_867039 [Rhizopogon salebrosus TDB-379]